MSVVGKTCKVTDRCLGTPSRLSFQPAPLNLMPVRERAQLRTQTAKSELPDDIMLEKSLTNRVVGPICPTTDMSLCLAGLLYIKRSIAASHHTLHNVPGPPHCCQVFFLHRSDCLAKYAASQNPRAGANRHCIANSSTRRDTTIATDQPSKSCTGPLFASNFEYHLLHS